MFAAQQVISRERRAQQIIKMKAEGQVYPITEGKDVSLPNTQTYRPPVKKSPMKDKDGYVGEPATPDATLMIKDQGVGTITKDVSTGSTVVS
jgi:hypothetical protein